MTPNLYVALAALAGGTPVKGPDTEGAEIGTWILVILAGLLTIAVGSFVVLILRNWVRETDA